MEYIQIFNRTTGQWSERYSQTSGFSESWVIDKTTDTGKDWRIEIKGETPPNIQPNDWVRILHVATKEETMTYDSNGIPTNSTQYLIKDVSCDYFWQSKKWIVGFTLKEPIERFNGVHGETLSFTNQTQKAFTELVGETPVTTTYYKAPYNHYTALRRWLMVTPANCDSYPETFKSLAVGTDLSFGKIKLTHQNLPEVYYETVITSTYGRITLSYDASLNVLVYNIRVYSKTGIVSIVAEGGVTSGSSTFNLPDMGAITSITEADTYGFSSFAEEYPISSDNISWYNRIKILDAEWLKSLPFADATYNELNLYNVLMDNFDASTGRTPVAYFDIDPVTDLPRNLDRDEYLLKFERQDGFDKPVIQFNDLKAGNIGYSITQESGNYATGLVCNAENISAASVVNYPAQNLWATPEYNDDNRTTTDNDIKGDNNWILRFPVPIKKINKLVELYLYGSRRLNTGIANIKRVSTDITSFVLEKKQYLAADPNGNPEQSNTYCWYEEGNNLLHLKRYCYDSDEAWIYYIEYEPLISCRLLIGNTEYQQQINQTASQIDAEKFSKYANEYLNGMAKADITIGQHYKRFSDFENLIGSRVQDGSKTYMITQVAYKNIGMAGYDVFMQLNENHTRKNNAYNAPQTIRTNTAIATENIKNRQTAIKQVVKIGTTAQVAEGYQFLTDKKIALSALKPNAIDGKYYPQVALLKGYSKLHTNSGLTAAADFNVTKLATVAKFQFGKQVNLVMTFFDNADAGKYKDVTEKNTGDTIYTINGVQRQVPIIYTDPFGETQKTTIVFGSKDNSELSDIETSGGSQEIWNEYYNTQNVYQAMANLPNVDSATITELESNTSAEIENQIYFKDMLEKLNVNTVIEVVGDDIIVCGGLLKYSRLLNKTDSHSITCYIYDSPKAENDTLTGYTTYEVPSSITFNSNYIRYNLAPLSNMTGKTLTITANNEKLLIFNNISATMATKLASGYFDIYFA